MSAPVIREARSRDAEAGAALLTASIRALCKADHGDDPDALAEWLGNKSPEHFRHWLGDARQTVLVAEAAGGRLAGVGLVADEGEVRLLYVAPDAVRRGVGKALLEGLERRAKLRGARRTWVRSTQSAFDFYARRGYVNDTDDPLRLAKPPQP